MQTINALADAELARQIRANAQGIIQRWVEVVRDTIPAAGPQRTPALVDHMPDFLERLAREFDPAASTQSTLQQASALAEAHGTLRSEHSDFSAGQILMEYTILRRIVFDVVEADRPLARAARNAILDLIDIGKQKAMVAYFDDRMTGEREERQKVEDHLQRALRTTKL